MQGPDSIPRPEPCPSTPDPPQRSPYQNQTIMGESIHHTHPALWLCEMPPHPKPQHPVGHPAVLPASPSSPRRKNGSKNTQEGVFLRLLLGICSPHATTCKRAAWIGVQGLVHPPSFKHPSSIHDRTCVGQGGGDRVEPAFLLLFLHTVCLI